MTGTPPGAYVPLSVRYYTDDALLEVGPVAELVFLRTLAVAGQVWETDGVVGERHLRRELLDVEPVVAAVSGGDVEDVLLKLERVGLLERTPGPPPGYRVLGWSRWNRAAAEVLADRDRKRGLDRERQARHRARAKGANDEVTDPVTRDVTPVTVSHGESRRTAAAAPTAADAAAAASAAAAAAPSPQPVDSLELPGGWGELAGLRLALEEERLVARWDRLTPEQLLEADRLVRLHGVAPLVASAKRQHRPDSPAAYASAWLGGWAELPAPRPRLVREPCEVHPYLPPAGVCSACASDRKAASS